MKKQLQKAMWREMRKMGIANKDIPPELQNKIVKATRKGPVGRLVQRSMTGIDDTRAARVTRTFEKNIGGKEELVEKLSAVEETLSPAQKELLALLKSPETKKYSLAKVLIEANVEPVSIMKAYAKGCVALGQALAAVEAHRNLPALIKNLYKHAFDNEEICKTCGGTGMCHARSNDVKEKAICPSCKGEGIFVSSSPHKEFATRQLLEVTKVVGKEPPQVNVAVGVKVDGEGGSFMEKMISTSDEILYSKKRPSQVIEAEVVSPDGSSSE